jgi:UDP-glucose 4-epimerase
MQVLLTGGLGYIGSHIAVALLEQGHRVVCIDNLANTTLATLEGITNICPAAAASNLTFIREDLLHRDELINIFTSHAIDAVIHLAGLKAVAESIKEPLAYYHNNLVSTLNLLTAMEAGKCRKLLFSSSATVYGGQESPLTEEHPVGVELTSPYGKTKFFIEEILRDYHRAHPELTTVLLRYFNPVGAHPSALIGEAPLGIPNNLLPIVARVAYAFNGPYKNQRLREGHEAAFLSIYGNDYPTTDGTCVRDFIHICDLADAHLAALAQESGYDVYNVGTGAGTSVLEMVMAYQTHNNLDIPYRFAPRRPGDSPSTYCSADKMYRTFGWKAKKQLKDIVMDSWRWTLASHP